MGRPLKNIDEKRSIQIVIKLNRAEYDKLVEFKSYYEKSISDCARYLIFSPRPMPPKNSKLDVEFVFQLKKLGINFNTYLKKIHQGQIKYANEALSNEVLQLLNKVQKSLQSNI